MQSKKVFGVETRLATNTFKDVEKIISNLYNKYKYVLAYGIHINGFNCNMSILARFSLVVDKQYKYNYNLWYEKPKFQEIIIIYGKTQRQIKNEFSRINRYRSNTIITLYKDNKTYDYKLLKEILKKCDFKPKFSFIGNEEMELWFKARK